METGMMKSFGSDIHIDSIHAPFIVPPQDERGKSPKQEKFHDKAKALG
jgi:hypothetical protein